MNATTQLETVNVKAEKFLGLGNQQPNIINRSLIIMKVQRLGESRRAELPEMRRIMRKVVTLAERFHFKVIKTDYCHEWNGYLMPNGYGQIRAFGKAMLTHRVAWILANGEIPGGQYVLHRCDNRRCVNPDHLFLGSFDDNMEDMVSKRRQAHGERNPHARLKVEQVLAIRATEGTHMTIAKQFGVSQALVTMIKNRKIWRYV